MNRKRRHEMEAMVVEHPLQHRIFYFFPFFGTLCVQNFYMWQAKKQQQNRFILQREMEKSHSTSQRESEREKKGKKK